MPAEITIGQSFVTKRENHPGVFGNMPAIRIANHYMKSVVQFKQNSPIN